jgi:hypothetical protein
VLPNLSSINRLSQQFRRNPLNLRHVIMQDGLLAAIIPFDGYACPICFDDGTEIGCRVSPANAIPDGQLSGFCAGHSIGHRYTPHCELDLSIRQLTPVFDNRQIAT